MAVYVACGSFHILSMIFNVIALSCYCGYFNTYYPNYCAYYGWSFGLGWAGVAMQLFAGLLYFGLMVV